MIEKRLQISSGLLSPENNLFKNVLSTKWKTTLSTLSPSLRFLFDFRMKLNKFDGQSSSDYIRSVWVTAEGPGPRTEDFTGVLWDRNLSLERTGEIPNTAQTDGVRRGSSPTLSETGKNFRREEVFRGPESSSVQYHPSRPLEDDKLNQTDCLSHTSHRENGGSPRPHESGVQRINTIILKTMRLRETKHQ